jgi:two-component system, OmpR family, phosphate regulon sensor histidine kinase PhoR
MRIGKNTIRLITGIMSAALLGLLALQWYWVDSALQLKEKEFDLQVRNALDRVAERLQDQELVRAVNADVQGRLIVEKKQTARIGADGKLVQHANIVVHHQDSTESPSQDPPAKSFAYRYETDGDTLRWQATGQQATMMVVADSKQIVLTEDIEETVENGEAHYAMSVVKRILQKPRPVAERVTRPQLDSLLREELSTRGIADLFVFGLDSMAAAVAGAQAPQFKSAYHVQLFPHDLPPSRDFLLLDFPDRSVGLMKALGLMLPTSALLALVLVGCFGAALVLLARQRRTAEAQRDFIHNMGHELKTPIATISLAVQALEDPDMRATGKTDAYIGIIRAENARMQAHVARVLEAAASARGELALALARIDLGPLVAEEMARMAFLLEARQGTQELIGGGTGYLIQGDATHIASILRNLLENAEKYSPEAPRITVRLQRDGDQIVLAVQDRGMGMSSTVQRRAFDPFYRAHTGDVHDVKGYGLGLSYVKDMVAAHGGSIRLESQPGKGTTFWLQFPAVP